jgi:hypothetical protein
MLDKDLWIFLYYLRHPVPIPDPCPPFLKFDVEKIRQFNEIQTRLNAKIAKLEMEKFNEFSKLIG